jgi:hypothetical protein
MLRRDQEAVAKATEIARQIALDAEASQGRHVSVTNSAGDEVSKVPIIRELHHHGKAK